MTGLFGCGCGYCDSIITVVNIIFPINTFCVLIYCIKIDLISIFKKYMKWNTIYKLIFSYFFSFLNDLLNLKKYLELNWIWFNSNIFSAVNRMAIVHGSDDITHIHICGFFPIEDMQTTSPPPQKWSDFLKDAECAE